MRKPYVILIGSASGIGKSTVSLELAKNLGIKHIIETDFIREIVRGIIGPEYAPALHKSSFNAYTTIKSQKNFSSMDDLIIEGFNEHSSFVIPAVEKVIQRAVADHDDILIEGVHLVPGLLNLDKFKDDADVYFFILMADEEAHKERFVKRAMQIRRGGKQLDYFRENRVIHDYLVNEGEINNLPIINNPNVEKTVEKMLSIINEVCRTILLQNSVEDLGDVIDIVISKNGGRIDDVKYPVPGFSEPLTRKVNISDSTQAKKFIKGLKENPDKQEGFKRLYDLSNNIRLNKICAPNEYSLDKIIKELGEKGYLYKEQPKFSEFEN
ncbi:MAG: 3H domain-containing protein [Methanobacteriaceae archaeon]